MGDLWGRGIGSAPGDAARTASPNADTLLPAVCLTLDASYRRRLAADEDEYEEQGS